MMKKNNPLEDVSLDLDPEFILTDGCMWEQNKQMGTSAPHAIEVVDVETGQVRYIKSGSRIKFVSGDITVGRSQELYNSQVTPEDEGK